MSTASSTGTASAMQHAVDTLEEEIVLGFLHPRERLVEDELLARFELKRHVVRQVLIELEQMGLVERKRNVGALVKSYSVEEVRNLYAVRELLETHCVKLIRFPVEQARLEALVDIQHAHDAAVQKGDPRSVFRLNVRFHRELFGLSDNPVLVEAIQSHAQRAHSIRASTMVIPEQLERARQEHWQIIEVLRHGDTEALVNLCRDHLTPSRDTYIDAHNRRSQRLSSDIAEAG